ncbi:hypothetical protein CFOL_v3_32877, partial [Cephalotus follicularis]
IFLSQRKYVLNLLDETGMLGSKPLDTPKDPNQKLMVDDGDVLEDLEKYRRLVGILNYLTVTRPYIAFPVSVVSHFLSSPQSSHLDAVILILYCDHGHRQVEGFSDVDWARSPSSRKSTTGYCVFVEGNLVSWKSKKQSVVAHSSAES